MVRVRATKKFEGLIDGAIGRTRKEGEEWEVDEARAEHLAKHGVAIILEEPKEPEEVKEPKKRGRKKKN